MQCCTSFFYLNIFLKDLIYSIFNKLILSFPVIYIMWLYNVLNEIGRDITKNIYNIKK